jgi:hypothetical protein
MKMQTEGHEATSVYLEAGRKRVFACAPAWPGWCRSGKSEADALAALAEYAGRYAAVPRQAGIPFVDRDPSLFTVLERLTGSAGYTDFGVPGVVATGDEEPWTGEEAERQITLLRAAWVVFDRIAAASPADLRKGPRGGGRDRDKLIDHVLGAEVAYARKLGVRHRQPAHDDPRAIAALREAIIAALRASAGEPPGAHVGWPARYAVRRIAWHVLDHAWEMEDRRIDA